MSQTVITEGRPPNRWGGQRECLLYLLAFVRVVLVVVVVASVTHAAPVYAAPPAQIDVDTILSGIQNIARICALVGVGLLGLKMTAPGQQVLQRVGLQVQDDYLIALVIASMLLSNVTAIVDFLGFGGGG